MSNPFAKDTIVHLDRVPHRVIRQISDTEVQIEHQTSGQISTRSINALCEAYLAGTLTIDVRRQISAPCVARESGDAHVSVADMGPSAQAETRCRIDILTRLERLGSFEKGTDGLRADLKLIGVELGRMAPHHTTVHRWRKRYVAMRCDLRALFSGIDRRGGAGVPRLDRAVEAAIFEKIDEIFLTKHRCSAEAVHEAVFLSIQEINTARIESQWAKVPSLRTIQRRISEIPAFERMVAERGVEEAERRFANMGAARSVSRILEIAEIDHSPVDALVTDDDGVVIGRPTITVVLDRKSRCCLGYHLSLAGHGVPAVFAALRHALLPKTYLQHAPAFLDLNLVWECCGWIETVLMDNGTEFHSKSVGDALLALGIAVEFARSRTPNDKPFVERFLKTFNYSFIHRLPGTTLARVGDRKGFKAEDEACLTLTELDRLIHVWIVEKYHLRPHAGLGGRAPITVWSEGARAHPPVFKANMDDVDIEFSNVAQSAVQHYGIDLNTFVYVSPQLLAMRRLLKRGSRVLVKWPAAEAGHILVFDPFERIYFRVPNKDDQYAGLTVEQAKLAKKTAAAGDPCYKLTGAKAGARIEEMVEVAKSSKKLKDRRRAARLANTTSAGSRRSPSELPIASAEANDPQLVTRTESLCCEDVFEVHVEIELPGGAE